MLHIVLFSPSISTSPTSFKVCSLTDWLNQMSWEQGTHQNMPDSGTPEVKEIKLIMIYFQERITTSLMTSLHDLSLFINV